MTNLINTSDNQTLYHDTIKLLEVYRDIKWSLELNTIKAGEELNLDFQNQTSIESYLNFIHMSGIVNLNNSKVKDISNTIYKNYQMIKILEDSLKLLKEKHENGKEYYWILYYTYIHKDKLETKDILKKLKNKIKSISTTKYYRLRKAAVNTLGTYLWGFTKIEYINILSCFIT